MFSVPYYPVAIASLVGLPLQAYALPTTPSPTPPYKQRRDDEYQSPSAQKKYMPLWIAVGIIVGIGGLVLISWYGTLQFRKHRREQRSFDIKIKRLKYKGDERGLPSPVLSGSHVVIPKVTEPHNALTTTVSNASHGRRGLVPSSFLGGGAPEIQHVDTQTSRHHHHLGDMGGDFGGAARAGVDGVNNSGSGGGHAG